MRQDLPVLALGEFLDHGYSPDLQLAPRERGQGSLIDPDTCTRGDGRS